MSQNRRSILGAALALPAALTAGSLMTATPAAAATGGVEAGEWADLILEPGITAQVGATPQVRIVTIAGTTFLQARGAITCNLTADAKIATMPATLRPTWYTRATAPRNNSQGINACRFEVNTAGSVSIYGANTGNPITWVQFDAVQTVWR
ncbi:MULTISPECIES: hypothetical protein [Streptomyces]|uniref:hypothetical protein n=1 Tax=Streptomyces TaxID=1883 RepID=UPI001318E1A3|nr:MULTISPECIES: hypothetical protein [Streptomyces]QGZ47415.1 hypothetical protein GPZ77_02465 [Streptomyces sp. QHH-9511]GGT79562.1 hypothetical protein GCM10010272_24410 [Streptomyces lateritius]